MSYVSYRHAEPIQPVASVYAPHSFAEYMDFGQKIVSFFNQDVPNNYSDMSHFMQKNFLRPVQNSRLSATFKQFNQSMYAVLDRQQKERLFELLKNNGFVHEILPAQNTFDIVIMMGGYLETMRQRLLFLDQLVASRHITLLDSSVVVLTSSKRVLEEGETSQYQGSKKRAVAYGHLHNEEDGARFVWHSTSLCPPLRRAHVRQICVPGKDSRTQDVCRYLMRQGLFSGRCRVLVVSSNPFVAYQALALKTLFVERGMPVDLIDYGGADTLFYSNDLNEKLGLVLDSVARTFYQKMQLDAVQKHCS